jgi:glutamate racemase
MTIGVFDSGIGGLVLFQQLDQHYPLASKIYLGDHANLPYGEKSSDNIVEFTYRGVLRLIELGCTSVVIACNTASILAVPLVRERLKRIRCKVEILDISSPTIQFLNVTSTALKITDDSTTDNERRVGVFATLATVRSEYFEKEICQRGATVVHQIACHQLVDTIESSLSVDRIRSDVIHFVAQLQRKFLGKPPNVAILGCTHYAVISDVFREALGKECRIVRQEHLIIEQLRRLNLLNPHPSRPVIRKIFTTGEKNTVTKAAERLFGDGVFMFTNLQPT